VLATASSGCDHGADGHARAQRVGAQATAIVADADADESGTSSGGDDVVQVPEAEGVPDATTPVEEAGSVGDEIEQDVGSPGSGEDESGSGGGSGSGSGSSSGGTIIIIYLDSSSPAPPSQTVDASVESGGTSDAGTEAPVPTPPDSGPETGAPQVAGFRLHVPARGSPSTGDDSGAPAFGDDSSSSLFDDAGPSPSAPPWGGLSDDGGDPNLDLPPGKAVIGCAGCSVPDATSSGTPAWLMVALTASVRTLRRRRR
jgi:MYXO-CTERM domain-containing protein